VPDGETLSRAETARFRARAARRGRRHQADML